MQQDNEGEYTCTATNTFTSQFDNETFELTVLDPERMSSTLSAGAISGIVIAVLLALAIPTVWIVYSRRLKKKAVDGQIEKQADIPAVVRN
ncbi:carcinoembryonic antigen-related cell adhesion molecule 20-like [Gigantopelta aegis]|uniref:carcinoembryonic antigen-related cell adhesion molecule 20-like n=1 Tax=Gigantopelta aegis TaxID=1735272 RepID=UPI001B88E105|nr:carcinoembryonic antigen-related cell adhesion molecule 20-like [Gigantopelta aegis]